MSARDRFLVALAFIAAVVIVTGNVLWAGSGTPAEVPHDYVQEWRGLVRRAGRRGRANGAERVVPGGGRDRRLCRRGAR